MLLTASYTLVILQAIYHFVCQKGSHFCVLPVDIAINFFAVTLIFFFANMYQSTSEHGLQTRPFQLRNHYLQYMMHTLTY